MAIIQKKREEKKVLLMAAKMDFARFIPLGIAYIAAYCEKEGYNVQVYDEIPDSNKTLSDTLISFKPDVIGISCMTATYTRARSYAISKAVLNRVRNRTDRSDCDVWINPSQCELQHISAQPGLHSARSVRSLSQGLILSGLGSACMSLV